MGQFGSSSKNMRNIDTTPGPNEYEKRSIFDDALQRKIGKSISGKFKDACMFNEQTLTSNAFGNY